MSENDLSEEQDNGFCYLIWQHVECSGNGKVDTTSKGIYLSSAESMMTRRPKSIMRSFVHWGILRACSDC